MGYQESFVTTKAQNHFDDFVMRIRELGREYYDYYGAWPKYIVNVKKNAHGIHNSAGLKQNEKYVYFTGERFLQRSAYTIINAAHAADSEWNNEKEFSGKRLKKPLFGLRIIFVEEIDGGQIFDTSKNKDGLIYAGLNNDWIEAADFVF